MDKESAINCKQVYELIAIGHCTVRDVDYAPGATIKTTDKRVKEFLVDKVKFARDVTAYLSTDEFDDTPVVSVKPASKEKESKAPVETKKRVTRTRK